MIVVKLDRVVLLNDCMNSGKCDGDGSIFSDNDWKKVVEVELLKKSFQSLQTPFKPQSLISLKFYATLMLSSISGRV